MHSLHGKRPHLGRLLRTHLLNRARAQENMRFLSALVLRWDGLPAPSFLKFNFTALDYQGDGFDPLFHVEIKISESAQLRFTPKLFVADLALSVHVHGVVRHHAQEALVAA